jgi:hypothetical protein
MFDIRINRLYHNYYDDTVFDDHIEGQGLWDAAAEVYQSAKKHDDNIV